MPRSNQDTRAKHIRLKCRWKDNEIRTVVLNPENCDFLAIINRLSNDYGFRVSLKYQDIDGDMIILNTQNDFDDLVRTELAETINVAVSVDTKAGSDPAEVEASGFSGGAGGGEKTLAPPPLLASARTSSPAAQHSPSASASAPSSSTPAKSREFSKAAAASGAGEGAPAKPRLVVVVDAKEMLVRDVDRDGKQVAIEDSGLALGGGGAPIAAFASPVRVSGIRKKSSPTTQPLAATDTMDSPLTSPGNSLNNSLNNSLLLNTLKNAKSAESAGAGGVGGSAADVITASGRSQRPSGSSKKHRQHQGDNQASTPTPSPVGGSVGGTGIRWKRGEMLGQGAFGVVYLGLNTSSGELMAVKQVTTDEVSSKELASLENEINLLRGLLHRNIVRYIGTEMHNGSLSIFLEYVPGGSLKALVDKFGKLEDSVAKTYTRQLLMGLEYLHTNGIAHRDIKGANCLVGNDGVCKLADFGNSKHWRHTGGSPSNKDGSVGAYGTDVNVQSVSGDIKGTPSWMAPEVIREQGSSQISWRKADVWSLACTTLEMVTGKPPWSQFSNSVTILYHIACQETLPEYPADASVELGSFLSVCLQRDPGKRPDTTSLLLHSFVSSNIGGQGGSNGFDNSPLQGIRNKGYDSPSGARHDLESSGSFDRLGGGYASPSHRLSTRHGPPGWYSSHGSSVQRPHSVSTDISNSHTTSAATRGTSKPAAELDGLTAPLPHSRDEQTTLGHNLVSPTQVPIIVTNSSVQIINEDKKREVPVSVIANSEMDNSVDSDELTSSSDKIQVPINLVPGRSSIVPSHNVPHLAVPLTLVNPSKVQDHERDESSTPPAAHHNVRNQSMDNAAMNAAPGNAEKALPRKLSNSSGERHDPERSHPRPDVRRAIEDSELDEVDGPPVLSRADSGVPGSDGGYGNLESSLDTSQSVDDSKGSKDDSTENFIQGGASQLGTADADYVSTNSTDKKPVRSGKKAVVLNDIVIPQKRNGIMGRTGPSNVAERSKLTASVVAEGNAARGIARASSIDETKLQLQSPPGGLGEVICPRSPRSPRSLRSGSLGSANSYISIDDASSDEQPRNRSDSFASLQSLGSTDVEGSQSLTTNLDHLIRPPLGQIPTLERPTSRQDKELGLSSTGIPISRISSLQNLADNEPGGSAPMSPTSQEARNLKSNASKRLKQLNRTRSGNSLARRGLESSADSFESSVDSPLLTSPRTLQALRINDEDNADVSDILGSDANRTLNSSKSLNNLTNYNLASVVPDRFQPQPHSREAAGSGSSTPGALSSSTSSQSLIGQSNVSVARTTGGRLPRQSPITVTHTNSHGDMSLALSRDSITEKAVRWGGTSHIDHEAFEAAAAAAADDASAGIIDNNDEDDSLESLTIERAGNIDTRMKNNPGLRLVIPAQSGNSLDTSPHAQPREQLGAPSPIAHRKRLDGTKNSSAILSRANNSHMQNLFPENGNGPGYSEQNRQGQWNPPPANGNGSPSKNDSSGGYRPAHRKGPLSAQARMTENRRERERERGTGMLSGNISVPSNRSPEDGMLSDDRDLFHGAARQHMVKGGHGVFDGAVEPDSDPLAPGFSTAPALMSKRRRQQSGKMNSPNRQETDILSKEKEAAANSSINAYYQQIGNKSSSMVAGAAKVSAEEEQSVASGGSYLPSPIRTSGGGPKKTRSANGALLRAGDASSGSMYSPGYGSPDGGGMSKSLVNSYDYPHADTNQPTAYRAQDASILGKPSGQPTKMSLGPSTSNEKSAHAIQRKLADEDNGDAGEEDSEDGDTYESDISGWNRPQILLEHKAAITRLRCPRGTDLLISSSLDGTVRIWSSDSNRRSSLAILDASSFNLPAGNADHRNVGRGMSAAQSDDNINSSIQTSIMNGTTIGGISEQSAGRAHVKITNVWAEANCASVWAACSDHALRVWSGAEGKPVRYLRGHEDSITCLEGMGVANSVTGGHNDYPDMDYGQSEFGSSLIATGSVDNTVRIWDARCKKAQIFLFKGHSDTVLAVRWGEGGRSVITAGKDKTIRIWDTRAGRLRTMIEKHFGSVTSLRAIPEHLGCSAIGGEAGDATTGSTYEAASFASGGRDSVVNLWTNTGNCVGSVSSHRQGVHYLSDINLFNYSTSAKTADVAKGKYVARVLPTIFSIGGEGAIKIWDLKRFRAIGDINVYSADSINAAKDLTDGSKAPLARGVWAHQSIVSAHGKEGNITMWNSDGSSGAWGSKNLAQHGSVCTDLLSTNSFVASASKSGNIYRWTPFNY